MNNIQPTDVDQLRITKTALDILKSDHLHTLELQNLDAATISKVIKIMSRLRDALRERRHVKLQISHVESKIKNIGVPKKQVNTFDGEKRMSDIRHESNNGFNRVMQHYASLA